MFTCRLVNNPFSDPGVYVKFKYRSEALLFDLGDLHALAPREILRVGHVFVSHTHMDHFIGFDHVLRICLGRNRHIRLFGPPGFVGHVESKLRSYTWNLVENYTNDFTLDVTEIEERKKSLWRFECRKKFIPELLENEGVFEGVVADAERFVVHGVFLDHKIPSLAFSLKERNRINIKRNLLDEYGLPTGRWLSVLKDAIGKGLPDSTEIEISGKTRAGDSVETKKTLGMLKGIAQVAPGKKMSYISDAVFSKENARRIVELAKESDVMFIEATFLEEDSEMAAEKYHLTAAQAGFLAGLANARSVRLFHFSPKYKRRAHLFEEEAMMALKSRSSLSETLPA